MPQRGHSPPLREVLNIQPDLLPYRRGIWKNRRHKDRGRQFNDKRSKYERAGRPARAKLFQQILRSMDTGADRAVLTLAPMVRLHCDIDRGEEGRAHKAQADRQSETALPLPLHIALPSPGLNFFYFTVRRPPLSTWRRPLPGRCPSHTARLLGAGRHGLHDRAAKPLLLQNGHGVDGGAAG